ncbi:MAG: hypothetical protein GY810_14905 [Aureispira sp.]|nr:hypothetical protein [Aureispira sp.]
MNYIIYLLSVVWMFNSDPVATLERTTCYGVCPYYKISVYADGRVVYEGKKHVGRIGKYVAKVPTVTIEKLLDKARAINYTQLENRYPSEGLGIVDFPMCITSIIIDGQQKEVYNRNDGPKELTTYQDFFDALFEDVEWEKAN